MKVRGPTTLPGTSGAERRKYVRVSADFMVKVKCGDTVITYPAAFARNISTGGIGIEIGGRYPDSFETLTHSADALGMEITLPTGEVLHVTAQVVWGHIEGTHTAEGERFKIGMRFIDLDDATKAKLDQFAKQKVNEAVTEHARAKDLRGTPRRPLPPV